MELLHTEILGSGEPMVLINGLGRTGQHWLGFDQELAKYYKLFVPDNRGLGNSHKMWADKGMSVNQMAQDIVDLLDAHKIDSAHVVGLSLGGMISLELGSKFAERVKSLTIINSSVGGTLRPRISIAAVVGLMTSAVARREMFDRSFDFLIGGAEERRQDIITEWQRIARDMKIPARVINRQLLAAIKYKGDGIESIKAPTFVIMSSDDKFVPPGNSKVIAKRIKNSVLKNFPIGGHEITVARPVELSASINELICTSI